MNRKYTKEDYLSLADKVKLSIPSICLTTDVIVGFPGETEEDFEETLEVLKKGRFDQVYSFLYSQRTGTPAAKNMDQIPEEVKKERFQRLVKVQNKISKEINEEFLNRELEVLVEGKSKTNDKIYTGRTGENKIVNFEGNAQLVGKLVKVRIDTIKTWTLEGTVI
jgi:tRNA-2-methylthio-N6-dimethylallyladenosine synthase